MEESTTYQAILRRGEKRGEERGEERGETRGIQETILQLGRLRFGEPSAEQARSLNGITNRERLQQLAARIFDVTTWQDLLA